MSEGTSEDHNPVSSLELNLTPGPDVLQVRDPAPSSNLVLVLDSEMDEITESEESSSSSSSEIETDTDELTTSDEEDLNLITERDDITLADSITDEIRRGVYTCLVCTGEVDQDSKIWSCHLCYRVYDLDCIKSWATKGSSTDIDRSWRCPACNGKHHKIPKSYTCWCGKIVNPVSNILSPHSCSNTCNHKLASCSHGCSLSCHPGPHIKRCGAIGPVMSCYCGEKEQQVPCIMTPYETGWSCGKICNDLMPCGIHKCPKSCHTGLCGACKEKIIGKCYCGKHEQEMFCYERKPQISIDENGEEWIGVYQCEQKCKHLFDCGNHFCEQQCHPQNAQSHECPLNPKLATTCPCGRVPILKLIDGGRKSCLEPIPTCNNTCGKKLPCGHECIWNCHEGECSPCYKQFTAKCSCNYSQFTVSCRFLQDGCTPKCNHKCQALLNCRRHRCNRICCADEPVAMNRERERKKLIRKLQLNSNEDDSMNIEAVHICTRECGKLLSCGLHYCNRSCHVGACPPCLESSSDDLICSCGKTVVPAPVRCGTKLPPCPFPCPRDPVCGHPKIPHNCHENDTECPKCTKLTVKICQCHRQIAVKSAMCFQKNVSCGNVCGKKLECGHKCSKTCHKDGECLKKCSSRCGAKRSCGHLDTAPCHYGKPCNENVPCPTVCVLTCPCKRITKEVACGATFTKPSIKDDILECDEECDRVERNRLLFEALRINTEAGNKSSISGAASPSLLSDDIIEKLLELENPYPKDLLYIYHRQKNWCLSIEKAFRNLILTKDMLKSTHHFPPMIQQQRQFVHELAEIYKFYSQSQDQEPRRSVMIQKLQSSKSPGMTLEEGYKCYMKLREREQLKKDKILNGIKEISAGNHSDIYFNAIVIQDVFFGVTRDDIENSISDILDSLKIMSSITKPITINYINEKSYVLYSTNHSQTSEKLENELYLLMKKISQRLKEKSIAFSCKLCKLDESGSVIYEIDGAGNAGFTTVGSSTSDLKEEEEEETLKQLALLDTNQQWW